MTQHAHVYHEAHFAQFGLIEPTRAERRRRWRAFGAGSVIELGGVLALVWLGMASPEPARRARYTSLQLAIPREPARPRRPATRVPGRAPPAESRVEAPRLRAPAIRPPTLVMPALDPTPQPATPTPALLTHCLPAVASSEVPKRDVPPVRTGGFGTVRREQPFGARRGRSRQVASVIPAVSGVMRPRTPQVTWLASDCSTCPGAPA